MVCAVCLSIFLWEYCWAVIASCTKKLQSWLTCAYTFPAWCEIISTFRNIHCWNLWKRDICNEWKSCRNICHIPIETTRYTMQTIIYATIYTNRKAKYIIIDQVRHLYKCNRYNYLQMHTQWILCIISYWYHYMLLSLPCPLKTSCILYWDNTHCDVIAIWCQWWRWGEH